MLYAAVTHFNTTVVVYFENIKEIFLCVIVCFARCLISIIDLKLKYFNIDIDIYSFRLAKFAIQSLIRYIM